MIQPLKRDKLIERLKDIKMLLLDVDGILTDGSIFYVTGQGWTRVYNINDGYGIRALIRKGFLVGVISGGESEELQERMRVLGIQHMVLGSEDKLASMKAISDETGILPEQMCFMADELFDMPAMKMVGLAITVPNGMPEVKEISHYVTVRSGGKGAVREIIDALCVAQGISLA